MGLKLGLSEGITQIERLYEQSAEENIWTYEQGSNRRTE